MPEFSQSHCQSQEKEEEEEQDAEAEAEQEAKAELSEEAEVTLLTGNESVMASGARNTEFSQS